MTLQEILESVKSGSVSVEEAGSDLQGTRHRSRFQLILCFKSTGSPALLCRKLSRSKNHQRARLKGNDPANRIFSISSCSCWRSRRHQLALRIPRVLPVGDLAVVRF